MLEKIFESLDEKVFTAELKESLQTQFDDAVNEKAQQIADERLEEEVAKLNEKSEEHIEELNEKAEQYIAEKKEEMVEALDKYLDRVVEEFVTEAQDSINESTKNEKAEMVLEALKSFTIAVGVDIATIQEAKDSESTEAKLAESVEKYDSLVEEVIALKEENENLIKMGAIAELSEGLSIVEAEKFKKLADLVEFSKDEAFVEKLETIKESVKSTKSTEIAEENLDESVDLDKKANDWSHLV